ncbi:Arp Ankyrin repeat [Pyrenophora tritici-repentis]|nr:Arp Ankyrin repeat [Pyrenophora tritici-repentis]
MAPAKETSVELCKRVNAQGNTIAIRMLEYLSTAKNPIHGFEALSRDFIELCQELWSIEAGVTEASKSRNAFPVEVSQELDRRLRQVTEEFLVLSQMVNKFVDKENHKGGFGMKFRMMFADTDVDKMRHTLARSRDALKVSSAMFRWSLGDAKADASMGIGYAGLIAALERLSPTKAASLPSIHSAPSPSLPPTPPTKAGSHHGTQASAPISQSLQRPYVNELRYGEGHAYESEISQYRPVEMGLSPGIVDLHKNWRAPASARSNESTRETQYHHNVNYHEDPLYEEVASSHSGRSPTMEEKLHGLTVHERYLDEHHPPHKVDSPITSPHWAPRQSGASKHAGGKAAVFLAVEQGRHRTLEQLLEGGARAEPHMESAMLRVAAEKEDVESVAILLKYGADANGFDREGITPLFASTRAQCIECAKRLLKHGADPNLSAGPDSESPLSLAASQSYIEFVKLFLAHGGDAGFIMENGSTALISAMNKTTSPKCVEVLLSAEGDADAKNGEGTTALFQAIQVNRVDLMTVLLDHGANPNLPGPKHPLWPSTYKPKALQLLLQRGADHKKTPGVMELASSLKKLESIKILMNAGVSPNIRKDNVYTPLCSAIRDNSAEIVTYLLENGADPNFNAAEYPAFKCITHKRTQFLPQLVAAGADLHKPKGIIETAVKFNNKDVIVYLLDQGVNPNDRTPDGCTALTTAIRENHLELVDLLLTRGADPSIRGQDWPLCMAVQRPPILKRLLAATTNPRAFRGVVEMAVVANQLESIKLLLAAGVSVEDKNCGVFSPLTTAIREERKTIVRYLLDVANADPNAPGEHLPIVKALRRYSGDPEIIQMLLTRGADINKMHRGWNAILQAVENGDAEILKLLIDMGGEADLQAVDESGRAVVDIVTERGWEEGLRLLFPDPRAGSPKGMAAAASAKTGGEMGGEEWSR